jgi:hemolysin activation/secretion protein
MKRAWLVGWAGHDNGGFTSYLSAIFLRFFLVLLVGCSGLLSGVGVALAQSPYPTLPADQPGKKGDPELHRQRQEQLLEIQRRRLNELRRGAPIDPLTPGAAQGDAQCYSIERIEIEGAPLLKASARAKLLAPFEGRCLNPGDLDAVLSAITGHYLSRGFVTTRAYLPEQNLGSGQLRITVIEGVLETLQPAPGSRVTQRELNVAFPGREGEILQLREIEQLLDQLSRLPSRQSSVELEPGSSPGDSRALIQTPADKDWRVHATRHNHGETSTGQHMLEAGVDWDSPLGLADQIGVRAAQGLSRTSNHGSRNASLAYSIPWGWWTATYSFLYSDYNSHYVNGDAGDIDTSGKTRVNNLRLERVLHRGAASKTAVNAVLDHASVDNYFDTYREDGRVTQGAKLPTLSPRLTEVGLGINHGHRLGSAYVNVDLGWQRGISWLGADHDEANLEKDQARAQYNKYTLAASFFQPFSLLSQQFSLESMAYWQKSEDILFGQRAISLGGNNSVRGFQDQSLVGNSGGYWRNQLVWSHSSPWFKPVFQEVSAALAWDVGRIQRDAFTRGDSAHDIPCRCGTLSGTALELSARSRYARASLIFAHSGKRPEILAKSETPFWFRLDLTY